MQLGRDFTAIRRQASWLAIKASMASKPRWPFAFQIVQTMNAGEQPPHSLTLQNRQATGVIPTRKGSVCPPPTAGEQRPSFLDAAKPPSYVSHPNPQGVSLPHADCGGSRGPHSLTLQNRQATGVIPTRKGSVCPPPIAGEQSGDRQRREKGPPILTAEKGELRARTTVGVSWPTPLRAT